MNTLIINAQPDYKNDAHYSIQLMNHFIGLFKEKYPNDTLEIRNLAGEWIPRATMDELLTVRGKQIAKKPLTEQEEKVAQRTDELLNDFMSFHRIVIVMPLHNFNIPSILKDYMDNILVARKTFKYTPEDSTVTISARREGAFVVVDVADDGPGVADCDKPHIFERFFTSSNTRPVDSRRSIGLGLSLCRSIVEAHGGVIEVRDNHPHGAVFRFTLPAEEIEIHE